MELFKKRETVLQNMTFIGIMAAINCILLYLTSLLPYLLILLTLILPFVNLMVCILCKKRFYPLYSIVTIGLCFIVSFNAISNIIFYIVPALLSGFIFGVCIEKEISPAYSILYSGFTYVICSYANMLICEFIINQPIQDLYFSIFNLNDFPFKNYLISLFMFIIGIIQSTLSYAFIKNGIKRMGIEEKDLEDGNFVLFTIIFILLTVITMILKPDMYLMFIAFTVYCFIYTDFDIFKTNKKVFIVTQLLAIFAGIFSFAILYDLLPRELTMSILLIPMFIVVIIALVNNCFVKKRI